MRIFALPLFAIVALALAGCNPSESQAPSTDEASANAPLATAIEGSVSLQDGHSITVSPEARLELKLVDISQQPSVPIAGKTMAVGTMPTQFSLPFSRDRVIDGDIYVLQALIVDGERRFTTPLEYPVLTQGAPTKVDVKMAPEPTAAELMLKEYNKLKSSIGGMTITQGTSLGDTSSRSWQIFKANGQVQYVKQIVDQFDSKRALTSRTTTDFAYKLGKPWVVVQKQMANADAAPSVIDRAGWNDAGELILNEHVSGGETSELSAEEASSLQEQAESMLKRAKG